MALNTITQITLPDGTEIALADWTDRPLYSACDLGSGYTDQRMELFQYTAGEPVPGAAPGTGFQLRSSTTNDTCMASAGELATTEEQLIYAIKPEVMEFLWDGADFNSRRYLGAPSAAGTSAVSMPAAALTTLAVLAQALLVQLQISEKDYAQAGFAYFNPGFGVFGMSTLVPLASGANGNTVGNNGIPSQQAVRSFALPCHIGGQEKFTLGLLNNGGNPVHFGKTVQGTPVVDPNVMVTIRTYTDGLYKRPVG
jgi:hypothetical protein